MEVVEEQLDFLEVLSVDESVDVVVACDVDRVVARIVGARHDSARLAVAKHHLVTLCTDTACHHHRQATRNENVPKTIINDTIIFFSLKLQSAVW